MPTLERKRDSLVSWLQNMLAGKACWIRAVDIMFAQKQRKGNTGKVQDKT